MVFAFLQCSGKIKAVGCPAAGRKHFTVKLDFHSAVGIFYIQHRVLRNVIKFKTLFIHSIPRQPRQTVLAPGSCFHCFRRIDQYAVSAFGKVSAHCRSAYFVAAAGKLQLRLVPARNRKTHIIFVMPLAAQITDITAAVQMVKQIKFFDLRSFYSININFAHCGVIKDQCQNIRGFLKFKTSAQPVIHALARMHIKRHTLFGTLIPLCRRILEPLLRNTHIAGVKAQFHRRYYAIEFAEIKRPRTVKRHNRFFAITLQRHAIFC